MTILAYEIEIEQLRADALLGWNPPLYWQGEPLMTLLEQVAGMAAGCVMHHAPNVEMPSAEIEAGILLVLASDPRPPRRDDPAPLP